MVEADKEGGRVRQPQHRKPAQSTSTRGRRGAVGKNRGVILPPHLRVRSGTPVLLSFCVLTQ